MMMTITMTTMTTKAPTAKTVQVCTLNIKKIYIQAWQFYASVRDFFLLTFGQIFSLSESQFLFQMAKTQERALAKMEIDHNRDWTCLVKEPSRSGPNLAPIVVLNHLSLMKGQSIQLTSIYLLVLHRAVPQLQLNQEYGHLLIWQAKKGRHRLHRPRHLRSTSPQRRLPRPGWLTPTAGQSCTAGCTRRRTRPTWPCWSTRGRWRWPRLLRPRRLLRRPRRRPPRWPSRHHLPAPDRWPPARRWRIDNKFDLF